MRCTYGAKTYQYTFLPWIHVCMYTCMHCPGYMSAVMRVHMAHMHTCMRICLGDASALPQQRGHSCFATCLVPLPPTKTTGETIFAFCPSCICTVELTALRFSCFHAHTCTRPFCVAEAYISYTCWRCFCTSRTRSYSCDVSCQNHRTKPFALLGHTFIRMLELFLRFFPFS
jgi:hypothetical protein